MQGAPKYSIVTTCKGRWHHLAHSLPAMLRQPDSEVIVVDYDCPDGTADRVGRDFPSARLVKVTEVAGFNASHARNSGAAVAAGHILVFVDADVVLSDRFIPFVETALGEDDFAKPEEPRTHLENSLQGTCVVHKRHFDLIGGYDEVLQNYGGEDLELYERLGTARVRKVFLDPLVFDRVIEHGQGDRGRFFGERSDLGFLVGKIYRIAKDMMIRINGSFDLDIRTRRRLYGEVMRLVRNMEGMDRKQLDLEINFPDNRAGGLHQTWQFRRSISIHVELRPDAGGERVSVRSGEAPATTDA